MNAWTPDGANAMTQNMVLPATSLVCTKPRAPGTPGGENARLAGPGSVVAASCTSPTASAADVKVATMSVTKPSVVEVQTRSPALRKLAWLKYDAIDAFGTAVATVNASCDSGPDAVAS